MRIIILFLCLLSAAIVSSQTITAGELYKKIKTYYLQNPHLVSYIEYLHKSVLGHDTTRGRFAYIPTRANDFMIAWIDPDYLLSNGLLVSDANYILDASRPEKIKVKKNELGGTIYSKLDYVSSHHNNDLEKAFGPIQSFYKAKGAYLVFTLKYSLHVDTGTFRIKTIIRYDMFEGKVQYDEYRFIPISDSIQKFLKQQALELAEASKDFSTTTFNEIEKKRKPVTSFEGQDFAFNQLVSFNKGSLDSSIKNKYVILDFFYQTCMPCHIMTNWILEWIPTMDTSKIILIGIDPVDSEASIQSFVKDKKINYPVIIGKQAKDIARYYTIYGYPTLFLLSPEGKIVNIHEGKSKSFLHKAEKIVAR
jgi:thiol-disulfide isomerase/thioredoxin